MAIKLKNMAFLLFFCAPITVFAADPMLPDPVLTPGVVLTTNKAQVCQPGYSATVRKTSENTKAAVFWRYGIEKDSKTYEIDHLIPLSLGGADVIENLWPQSYNSIPFNAHIKDKIEVRMLHMVCHEHYSLEKAQAEIAKDWIAAYHANCLRDCVGGLFEKAD